MENTRQIKKHTHKQEKTVYCRKKVFISNHFSITYHIHVKIVNNVWNQTKLWAKEIYLKVILEVKKFSWCAEKVWERVSNRSSHELQSLELEKSGDNGTIQNVHKQYLGMLQSLTNLTETLEGIFKENC